MSDLIWITGASSGIGRALALEWSARGGRVAITARRAEELRELAASTARIFSFPGDVSEVDDMRRTVAAIEDQLGPLAGAVLNAGIYLHTRAVPFERDQFVAQINVNQLGCVNALDALLPRLTGRRAGFVYLVSSVTGFSGLPTAAAYGSTKAALINMAECLKFDLDAYGVHIGVITPGFVDTPMIAQSSYAKPFMITPAQAARRIVEGVERRRFEITFPRRLSYAYKLARLLPYTFYFPLMKRIARAGGRT